MQQVAIASTARAPVAKAFRGAFNSTGGVELAEAILRTVLERGKVAPPEVEE